MNCTSRHLIKKTLTAFSIVPIGLFGIRDLTAAIINAVNSSAPYPETVTAEELKEKYDNNQKIKILLAPGHDLKNPGAVFGKVREEEINRKMADYLRERTENDERFETFITRETKNGAYASTFVEYLKKRDDIEKWRNTVDSIYRGHLTAGRLKKEVLVHHNSADRRVSTVLYGINKWANENDIDIVLHIHFNDYAGRKRMGRYSGFSIYVPENQLPNSRASVALAESIYKRLNSRFPSSDLPKEDIGIVPDQELIAVGAKASRRKISILIEYGYIYEKQFESEEVREKVLREMAYQTYLGIKDFFELNTIEDKESTTLLPYHFEKILQRGMKGETDVLHLQAALRLEGLYPPEGKTLSDCPLNGVFGQCVEKSVKDFQEKYKEEILKPLEIGEATGKVGSSTMNKLNELFGDS